MTGNRPHPPSRGQYPTAAQTRSTSRIQPNEDRCGQDIPETSLTCAQGARFPKTRVRIRPSVRRRLTGPSHTAGIAFLPGRLGSLQGTPRVRARAGGWR